MWEPISDLLGLLPRDSRPRLVRIVLLLATCAALEMVSIGALFPLIIVIQSPDALSQHALFGPLLRANPLLAGSVSVQSMLLFLLGFFVAKNTFMVFVDARQYRFLAEWQALLSTQLFAEYLGRPYVFHVATHSSQLVRNVTSEISSAFYFGMVPSLVLAAELLVMAGLISLAFVIDAPTALVMVAMGGALLSGYVFFARNRMKEIGVLAQTSTGRMIRTAQESLGGMKELKLLGNARHFENAFGRHVHDNGRALRRGLVVHNFPMRALELAFIAACVAALLYLSGRSRPQEFMPILAVYAAVAFRLIPGLNRIITSIGRIKQGAPSVRLIASELNQAPDTMRTIVRPCPRLDRAIDVLGLECFYPGADKAALTDVSLRIGRGEMVAMVGKSGSGKTTLVDCIAGLLPISRGRILVDGFDIEGDPAGWRAQIGYIAQQVHLIDDSIVRNIAFGVKDAEIDGERVRSAIRAANLDEFVASLPDGLETPIGERGGRLSGGQQQRIGIARALYREPEVLILDEATSALDPETEADIVRTIAELKGSRTIIVIAHRLSTVTDCDRIFRIESGRLQLD